MRHLLPFLALVVTFVQSPLPTAAQEATPPSTRHGAAEGFVGQAIREFDRSGTLFIGTTVMTFMVAEFDSTENAEKAVPWVTRAVLGSIANQGTLKPTSAPTFGDSTRAYTGQLEIEGDTFDAAVLSGRYGRYVHVWFAAGLMAAPLGDLTTVANRVRQDMLEESAAPESGELLDRLPTLRDMLPGFVLSNQEVIPAAQPVGTPAN